MTSNEHKFNEYMNHVGHRIEIVTYGNNPTEVWNVAIECHDCHVVIEDCDNPEIESDE